MSEQELLVASRLRRVTAYIIDIIPVTLLVFLGAALVSVDFREAFKALLLIAQHPEQSQEVAARLEGMESLIRFLTISLWVAYSTVMDASKHQGTFGKKLMRLKVIKVDGSPLTLGDSLKRNLFKFVSHSVFMLGFFWSLFHKRGQAWHDLFAKAVVVSQQSTR